MRRLQVQLALAFAIVTALSVLTAASLAHLQAGAGFRVFLVQAQLQQLGLVPRLIEYYAVHHSWTGVATVFADSRGMGPGSMGPGIGNPGMMRGPLELTLADADGTIVYRAGLPGGTTATHVSASERNAALPIVVDGVIAGYLTASTPRYAALSLAAQHFLDQLNQAFLQAGVLAGMLGLLLGVIIARSLAAPLDRLAQAAQRLAAGDLAQRAPISGPIEVASAAAAFNTMAASLEQSELARRRMIADIAHELRTPLTVIQGNLRALLDDVFPLQKEEIATIYDETLVLHRLVADLRELTLAESGQIDLRREPIDLAASIARTMASFAAPAAEKGVELRAECAPDLPRAVADGDRIVQVLNNLVSNALRHTPSGGTIQLRATADPRAFPGTIEPGAPALYVSVCDTGPGIAPADVPFVFERFWRADRGRARSQGGSGLGLAIARQLVLAHGGQIGVVSEPGQGACFWFTLPIATVV